jgi:DNA invertase Pin-like site-specific DNA recombinase
VTRLPTSVDELRGLRAARWIRESTPGQFDRYGPDAQRALQDGAIARLGLVETIPISEYLAAHSGSTVHASPSMLAMLADARGGRFDVLVVGYVARWQRNLRQTLNLLEDILHPAGVAVWFADEELLSSNDRHWDQLVDEAKGAESWLRKHRRRVREGLAAKLREKRDPGGHPPFGFRRNEAKLLEPDPGHRARVRRAFELAAAGLTDRQVATATELTIHVVRGMLRNPLYAGRLPDGRPTAFAPIVGSALWNDVHAARERRRTRDGRPARRRAYALSMLRCAACGRRLIGDTGRYRHTDPCPAFLEAARQPKRRRRGQHRVVPGRSYAAEAYEALVAAVLARVSLGADVITEAIAESRAPEPDRVGLARIERERDQAIARYRRTRDAAELERTMARLDTDALLARQDRGPVPLPADQAAAYLRDLPSWWADAPNTRRELAEFLFARIDVLGLRTMRIVPTRAALERGLVDAFHARSAGYGRGERGRGEANRLIVRVVPGIPTRITIVVDARPAPLVAERSA